MTATPNPLLPGTRADWEWPYRVMVVLGACVPLFFGAAWTWTFGFTSYRSHLAFIGVPLGLTFLVVSSGMLAMRRWAIVTSVPLAVLATIASLWIASVSGHWFYWVVALLGAAYSALVTRRLFARSS